jgi:hypothetical protein
MELTHVVFNFVACMAPVRFITDRYLDKYLNNILNLQIFVQKFLHDLFLSFRDSMLG